MTVSWLFLLEQSQGMTCRSWVPGMSLLYENLFLPEVSKDNHSSYNFLGTCHVPVTFVSGHHSRFVGFQVMKEKDTPRDFLSQKVES